MSYKCDTHDSDVLTQAVHSAPCSNLYLGGKVFHSRSAAVEKLLSLKLVSERPWYNQCLVEMRTTMFGVHVDVNSPQKPNGQAMNKEQNRPKR